MNRLTALLAAPLLAGVILVFSATPAVAHCDSMNGPVVLAAQKALSTGDLAPLLKWVAEDDEAEVAQAFERTMKVRDNSDEVKEMADMYFFETVVRLHRMSEGVGYTGLKAATTVDPGIAAADLALETGSIEALEHLVLNHVREAMHERYADAIEAKAHADHNTAAGRRYVEAYVRYTHLVEEIGNAITHSASHGARSAAGHHAH